MSRANNPSIQSLVKPKIQFLYSDSEKLQSSQLPGIAPAMRIALEFAGEIVEESDEFSLVGVLYVLEGSQSGAVFLRSAYARCLGLSPEQLSYFGCYGNDTKASWRSFVERLNSMNVSANEADDAVRLAVHTFEKFEAICKALYPFAEDDLAFEASGINPEAGDHAIPQDPLEIDLALRAGRQAWLSFPYLSERFGERGKRFTNSDCCWLVAITKLPIEHVTKSLTWLRKVLAVRGIPTIILEQHLRQIATALGSESPQGHDRATRYSAFLSILDAERISHDPSGLLDEMIKSFDQKFSLCTGPKVDSAARLLASAWVDERTGIAGALDATEGWFADSERFSEEWVKTVKELQQALDAFSPC